MRIVYGSDSMDVMKLLEKLNVKLPEKILIGALQKRIKIPYN